nr:galactinol synthase 2 [Tanacetum cinerariifolium]
MLWRHPENFDLEKVKVVHYCADGSKPWRYTGKEVNMDREDIKMLVKKWWDIYNDESLDYWRIRGDSMPIMMLDKPHVASKKGSRYSSLWTRVIKAIHGDDGKLDKDVIVVGQTCWTSIVKEARSLKGTGINVVDLIRLKLRNGDSFSFWEEKWYTGGVIKELFSRLYDLELHKHATVRMKLMAPSLDDSFRRRVRSGAEETQFNYLLEIVQVINLVPCEDRMACVAGVYSDSQQAEKYDGRSLLWFVVVYMEFQK